MYLLYNIHYTHLQTELDFCTATRKYLLIRTGSWKNARVKRVVVITTRSTARRMCAYVLRVYTIVYYATWKSEKTNIRCWYTINRDVAYHIRVCSKIYVLPFR